MHKPGISLDRARSIDTLAPIASPDKFPSGILCRWRRGPGRAKAAEECRMADTINDKAGRRDEQGGRRPRQGIKRAYRVEFSLTGEEFELLGAAAERSGRARGAYAAEAAKSERKSTRLNSSHLGIS